MRHWCGHCNSMEPAWKKLESNHPEGVTLSKIEADEYDEYEPSNNEDRPQGYPTLRLYYKGDFIKEYEGDRSFESIYAFIEDFINENPDVKLNNFLEVNKVIK